MSAPRMSPLSTRGAIAAVAVLALSTVGLVVADPAAAATTITVTSFTDADANGACSTPSVTTTASPVTLRNALCVASNLGGESTITVPGGTYTLTGGALKLGTQSGTDVRLASSGGRASVVGGGTTQLLAIDADLVGDISVEIDGFAFTGGRDTVYGGGAIIAGSFTAASPDSLVVRDTRFIDNRSTGGTANPGGAIQFIGGDLTIEDSTFDGNDAGPANGGAVYYEASASGDALSVTDSTFTNNRVTASAGIVAGGGAIAIDSNGVGTAQITGSTFGSNVADGTSGTAARGGAIQQLQGPSTVTGNVFTANVASGASAGGGALDAADGALSAQYNSFSGNTGAAAVRTSATTVATLTNSWWGCNGGPGAAGCDTTSIASGSANPYLVLSATTSASVIDTASTATFTASLRTNSAGSTIGGANLSAFEGATVGWTGVAPSGSSVSSSAFHLGEATTTFTSGSTGGPGGATATFGAASVPVSVAVRQIAAFTSAASATATVGTPFNFTVTATGFPVPNISLTSPSAPPGLTFSAGSGSATLSGTPTSSGTYPLTLTASNGGAPVQQTLTVTIGAAPSFTGSLTASVADGDPVDVTITASGSPVPEIAATGGLPAGLQLDDNGDGTARLHGTSTAGPGEHVIHLTAANALGTTPADFTLTITAPPAFTSADHTTFTVGTPGLFPIVVDAGFPALNTVTLTGAPAWLTLLGAAGMQQLQATPPAGAGGTYTFDLAITGSSVTQEFTLTVHEAPVITDQPDSISVIAGADADFTAAASGYPTPTVQWQRFTGGSWTAIAGETSTTLSIDTTIADAGARLRAVFTSAAGTATSDEAVLSVGQVPVLDEVDPVTAPVGTPLTVDIASTGIPVSALTATGVPAWLTFTDAGDGTATLTGTPALTDAGSVGITVTADNGFGTDQVTVDITVVGALPAFLGAMVATVDRGEPVDITIATTGTPAPTIAATGPVPAGLSLDDNGDGTARLHGTPTAAGGEYSIALSATNIHGTEPGSFFLTIREAPSFTSADHTTFTVGSAGSFPVTVSPGFPVKNAVSISGAPAWLSLDGVAGSQTLVGTPPAGSGGTVSFELSIDGSSVTQSFTLTVNEAPVITAQPVAATVLEGTDATFTATATGYPAPTVQWQRFTGGSWSDIAGATGTTLTFAPTIGDDGTLFRAVFTNTAGSATSDEVLLTVGQTPVVDAVDPITALAGAAVTVDITSTGLPVSTLTATGVPAWLTFTDAGDGTATLTGTPALADAGAVEITVTAANGFGTTETTVQITVLTTVALPSVLPSASDGALTGVPASVVRGQQLTIGGSGFLPGATIQLGIYSVPTMLGTTVADGTGSFSAVITIPAGQTLGAHTIAAVGIGAEGTARLLTATTTVVAPATGGGTGTGGLAATGADATPSLGLGLIALFALLGGLALIRGARRRLA